MPDHGRPLSLSLRPDLVTVRETFGERTYVVLKDPVALRYFRLREEEFALVELLDGQRSFIEIQTTLEARFAPQKFPPEAMSNFVATMHQAGLLRSELPGQAAPLLQRRSKGRRQRWLQALMSPLSLRVRGIDPTWLFDRIYPWCRWCFTRPALLAATTLIIAALGLFAVYHAAVLSRLPTWQEFFTPTNLLLLLALTACIKVLHEFGHGLTCRHFGGEVHELGLMFLVFAPCLYCNVSDAWRMPKRARLAVSAAGIFVELVLASCAAFGWWLTQPGLLNQLCLGTMFVSGVSTLLINGNPLMRYDGYFLLADFLETPNLAEKSGTVVRNFFSRLCFGIEAEPDFTMPERHRGWLALYGVASTIYRFVLTFSIVLMLFELARPYNLENLVRIYAMISFGSLLFPPLNRFVRFLRHHVAAADFRKLRVAGSTLAAVAAVAFLIYWPLPQRVWGTLEIEPRDVERIYVDGPGRPVEVRFRPGDVVPPGSVLTKLENIDLELEIARLAGKAAEQEAQLTSLHRERYHNDSAAAQIPELEKSLLSVREMLTEKRSEAERLTLRTVRGGTMLPPAETPSQRDQAHGELPTWWGLPTDLGNLGATFTPGTLYCQLGDPHEWQALLVVDQADVGHVRVGQSVEIRFDEMPDFVVAARVDEISRREMAESPRHLSNRVGGELPTEPDAAGVQRPVSATYQVRVVLYDPRALLRIGLRGTARIHVAPEPLAPRAGRWLARMFHFQM